MQRRIQQQTRTIEYIKTKYKEKTGEEILMPKTWEDYLAMDQDEVPSCPLPSIEQKTTTKVHTFQTAIDALSLPSRLSYSKAPLTSFNAANKFHMIESIDLSHFRDRDFNKNTLRQFLGRIVEMRCLRVVSLKDNGIGEECTEEIETLLTMKRITRVDLSQNKMGKNCLQIISKNFNHLEWVEQGLSRNSFLFEKFGLQALLNAMRVNGKLYHVQMDWQDPKMVTTFCSYLKIKAHIHSLGPIDSKIPPEAMGYICEVLTIKEAKRQNYRVNSLNFDFCYLEKPVFAQLLKALPFNNSLIKLSLAHNNLGTEMAVQLMEVLGSSISLVEVSLVHNLLEDEFAAALGKCLASNEILQVVDIGRNNLGKEGGQTLLKTLTEQNDTLESLGDIESNERLGQELIQKIKRALRVNRVSKEVRSQIISQEPDLPVAEVTSRQTEAFLDSEFRDYPLLQPIAVTNPIREDPFKLHIWNFD